MASTEFENGRRSIEEAIKPPTIGERLARYRVIAVDAFTELYKSKTAFVGMLMLVALFAVLLLTPVLTKYDPVKPDYTAFLQKPSAEHIMGTDRYGRDIYSRVLWGGRRLVTIAILAVVFGLAIGIPYGV